MYREKTRKYNTFIIRIFLYKKGLCLDGHNSRRALHQNTPPLEYDNQIEREAQEWANYLAARGSNLVHESGTPYGENLGYAYHSSQPPSASSALDMILKGWYVI